MQIQELVCIPHLGRDLSHQGAAPRVPHPNEYFLKEMDLVVMSVLGGPRAPREKG
jgi:hypothetical protein